MEQLARNPNPARHHEWSARDGSVHELIDLQKGLQLALLPGDEDKTGAVPTDPENCVLARCASRLSGLPSMVGRDVAYIPATIGGRQAMWRCKVPKPTRDALEHYDKTGEFPEGGFVFRGISPSQELDSKRARNKRLRQRWGSKSAHTGKKLQQPLRNASRRAQVFVDERAKS